MGSHGINVFAAMLASVALLAAGGASAAKAVAKAGPPVSVQMTEDGPVFATLAGMTLYSWAKEDTTPGKAQCGNERHSSTRIVTGEVIPLPAADKRRSCLQKWSPLLADANASPQGPWSLITRDGGARQWAYEGHPLYSSVKDRRPGDVNGLGFGRSGLGGGGWRQAFAPLGFPPGLKLIRRPQGLVLATADDRPLYVRQGAQRACAGCDEPLQPLRAAAVAEPRGDWSVIDAGSGRRQHAFKGQPLYAASRKTEDADFGSGWAQALYRPTAGRPADISTRFSVIGEVYTTRTGMGLYVFSCTTPGADNLSCDDPGDAAAYWSVLCGLATDCDKRWRLALAPPGARQIGEWSVVDVAVPLYGDPGGTTYLPSEAPATVKAWAYRGRPLHTYVLDEFPGQILGHATQPGNSGFDAIPVEGAEVER